MCIDTQNTHMWMYMMYISIYDCGRIVNYDNYGMTMMLNEKPYHCITLIVIFHDILVWGLHGKQLSSDSQESYLQICMYIILYIYII